MEQLYAPSIGSPIETPTPPRRSRLAGLALRPEPRPKARRPPTRFHARGDEPRRTEFDLQGQHLVRTLPGPTALLCGPVVRIAARVSEAARLGRGRALPGRHEYRDGTERRYVVADVGGAFICPACETQATLISGG